MSPAITLVLGVIALAVCIAATLKWSKRGKK